MVTGVLALLIWSTHSTAQGPDESIAVWAKFPAPPPNVEKITVVIAKTPPFEEIVIAK